MHQREETESMSYRPLTTSVLLLFGSADFPEEQTERDLPSSDLLLLLLLKSCPVAAAAVFRALVLSSLSLCVCVWCYLEKQYWLEGKFWRR